MATKSEDGGQKTEDGIKPNAAAAEPTDADLMAILQTGTAAPAGGAKKKAKPAAVEDEDAEIEAEEDGEDLEDEGDPASPKASQGKGVAKADDGLEDDAADGEDDEGDDAELDEEDDETRASFTPAQQKKFDAAQAKKTRRILALREELQEEKQLRETAERERDEVRSNPPTALIPSAENPLADVEDEAKLDARLGDARKLRRFALANADGAYVDTKTGAVVELELEEGEKAPEGIAHFSKRRIGEILADTEELLNEHGPKRRKFLQDRTAAEADAVQEFPALKNRNSQVALDVEAQLRRSPALRSVPGIRLILADAFIGRHARAKAKAALKLGADKPGAGERKAPPSPGGGTKPGKISGREKVALGAQQTLAKTGDDPDNAGLLAILRS